MNFWSMHLVALDKATGVRKLDEKSAQQPGFRSLTINARDRFIELRGWNDRLRLYPSEQAAVVTPPTPEAKPTDKPAADKPAADNPVDNKPTEEKATPEKPAQDKPAAEKPTVEKQVGDPANPATPEKPGGAGADQTGGKVPAKPGGD